AFGSIHSKRGTAPPRPARLCLIGLLSSATERAKSWGQVISQTGSTPCSGRRHQSFDHATWDHARKRALEKRQSVGRPASRPVAVRLYCYHRNLFIPVSTCPSRSVARDDINDPTICLVPLSAAVIGSASAQASAWRRQ